MAEYAGKTSGYNTKGQAEPYTQGEARATLNEVFK
jgi:hypothetical protein